MPRHNPRLLIPLAVLLVAGVGFVVYRLVVARPAEIVTAEEALARREFKLAVENLERHLANHPTDREARILAAQAARRAGNLATAGDHLRQCERGGGSPDGVVRERRLMRAQSGDLREAVSLAAAAADGPATSDTPLACEAAVVGILAALSPDGADEVLIAEAAPFLAAARRATDRWLALRPGREDRAAGLVWRGRIHDLGGDHAAATDDFRRALEIDPESADAQFFLAVAVSQANPGDAVARLAALRERHPADTRVRLALATSYRAVGRLEESAALLDEALAADPDNVPALIGRGKVALDAGRPAESEPFLLRALRIRPDLPLVHLSLGQCMELLGDPKRAKEYRDRYVQLEAEQKRSSAGPRPKP